MRVLMLVATNVANDTRVLREATTLVDAGHVIHIIGRSVPPGYCPPPGVSVSSVGTSSVFRAEGAPSLGGRRLPWHIRLARWLLLPWHRQSAFRRWGAGAVRDGLTREFDVVHAHDFTALEAGSILAERAGVPYVYDTHELWSGLPREYRPTPWLDQRERALERRLGARAAAVITVGDGVGQALRQRYGWAHIVIVRNTFPEGGGVTGRGGASVSTEPSPASPVPSPEPSSDPSARVSASASTPRGLVYAGRLSAFRELETIAAASNRIDLPITLIGPADEAWLASFDPGRCTVEPPCSPEEVDAHLIGAGLVLVTHSDRWENHRLALPNKLFHAVRSGVPVVATDVGELAKTVRQYGIGTLYRPGDAAELVRAVALAISEYDSLREAVRAAATQLSWDTDARRLLGVYEGFTCPDASKQRTGR